MQATRVYAALAALLLGCGDDEAAPVDAPVDTAPVAADFAGFWLISSVTLPSQGGYLTLLRGGDPMGFRGDTVFAATGPTSGTLDVRQVVLNEGLIAGEIMSLVAQIEVESGRWLLTEPGGGVAVFTTTLAGDHLELMLDPADPRVTSTDPPKQIIVDRVPPWTTTLVGSWELVSMQTPDGMVYANTCIELDPGVTWGKVAMAIAIDPRLLFQRDMTMTTFSDDQCANRTGESTSTQLGFAEQEGAALRIWGVEAGEAEYQGFSVSASGDETSLTRTACLPAPDCEGSAPLVVVVRRK
jgi:hypothetical protein